MSRDTRRRHERAGRFAETLAAIYLRFKGYRILERRFKTKLGEIDIIALNKDTVVVVEVKQRQTQLDAHESISKTAEKRIEDAANIYVSKNPALQTLGLRFDVVFFIGPLKLWRARIEHIENAW